jgi:hypothetical protein
MLHESTSPRWINSTSLVVAAAETILKQQIPGVFRNPRTFEELAHNIDMVVSKKICITVPTSL